MERCFNGDYASAVRNPIVVEATDRLVTWLDGYANATQDEEIMEFLKDLRAHKRLEVWIE